MAGLLLGALGWSGFVIGQGDPKTPPSGLILGVSGCSCSLNPLGGFEGLREPSEAFGPSGLRGLKALLGASGHFGGFGGRCQSQYPGLVAFLFFWASRGSVSHDGGLCFPVFMVEVIGQGALKRIRAGSFWGVLGVRGP